MPQGSFELLTRLFSEKPWAVPRSAHSSASGKTERHAYSNRSQHQRDCGLINTARRPARSPGMHAAPLGRLESSRAAPPVMECEARSFGVGCYSRPDLLEREVSLGQNHRFFSDGSDSPATRGLAVRRINGMEERLLPLKIFVSIL